MPRFSLSYLDFANGILFEAPTLSISQVHFSYARKGWMSSLPVPMPVFSRPPLRKGLTSSTLFKRLER